MSLTKADPNKQGWEAAVSDYNQIKIVMFFSVMLTFVVGIPHSLRDMLG